VGSADAVLALGEAADIPSDSGANEAVFEDGAGRAGVRSAQGWLEVFLVRFLEEDRLQYPGLSGLVPAGEDSAEHCLRLQHSLLSNSHFYDFRHKEVVGQS
jgi:hypothetical protein